MAADALLERLKREGWKVVQEWLDNHEEETLHLDFKKKADPTVAKLDTDDIGNLAKAISAFANTEGGLLVFGIKTGRIQGQPDYADTADPIDNLAAFQQSVENRLRELLDPPVSGIDPLRIEHSDGSDRGVLAIYVPPSDARPHQCLGGDKQVNNRFYMRMASTSGPMPRAMIAAQFGRLPHPKLRLRIQLAIAEQAGWQFRLAVTMHLSNVGKGIARQPAVRLEEHSPLLWSKTFGTVGGHLDPWSTTRAQHEAGQPLSITLRANSETVIYPEDTFPIISGLPLGGMRHYFEVNKLHFKLRGTLYAVDAAPIDFDQKIDFNQKPDGHEFIVPEN